MEMKIEKRFYDDARQQCEEIWDALIKEKETLPKEEWEAEARALETDLQKIKNTCEEKSRRSRRESDERKLQQFRTLSRQALWMAEYLALNIQIEEYDNFCGKIILEADGIMIVCNTDAAVRQILCSLLLHASEIYTGTSSGLCRMEFVFQLYRETPAEQTAG